ncbi:MAG TPA: rhodanese-like domain-containing protein [Gemmatimonas sp.]|nr:rhodanese-like domain-containing protein [Gemmatimonas sp.]
MKKFLAAFLLPLVAASPRTSLAQSDGAHPATRGVPRPGMLVSTAWLAEHATDKDLVVLHVGRRAQYDSGHIAGARPVALSDISLPSGPGKLSLQMPGVAELTAWAKTHGIGDRTRVIVVPHDDTLQSSTRVFLTLAYLGAMERTSLLDGGFKTWRSEGRAVSAAPPGDAPAVTFTPRPRPDLIATMEQVEAATLDGRVSIVDARLPRFFEGNGGGYPRPGHIPTAVNIPLNTVSEPSGRFRAPPELRELFVAAGVPGTKPVITYCHIGQQATLLWFVATMLGYDARMYDGSFQEWSGTERLPVVLPPKK